MDQVLPESFRSDFKVIAQRHVEGQVASQRSSLNDHMRQVENYYKQASAYLEAASTCRRTIEAFEAYDAEKVFVTIEKIAASPFWEFVGVHGDYVKFKTRERVIMTQVNPAAGVNNAVDMGRYLIELWPMIGRVLVKPLEDNCRVDRGGSYCYHPFLSTKHEVCWGTGQSLASKMQMNGEFDKLFQMLAALLTSLENGSNPYFDLIHFKYDREAPRCVDCKNRVRDCSCPKCNVCKKTEKICDCKPCENGNCRHYTRVLLTSADTFCRGCLKDQEEARYRPGGCDKCGDRIFKEFTLCDSCANYKDCNGFDQNEGCGVRILKEVELCNGCMDLKNTKECDDCEERIPLDSPHSHCDDCREEDFQEETIPFDPVTPVPAAFDPFTANDTYTMPPVDHMGVPRAARGNE